MSKATVAPFDGLKVIDFTHVLAGPACAYYLGLLGAEVIKVESVSKGDSMRCRGGSDAIGAAAGMSTAYVTQAAGKQAIALDLSRPGGLTVFKKLLAGADVLVENHLPATLTRLGLEQPALLGDNPALIHCAMTGYGRGGSMQNAPAYDVNIQAACGLMSVTGTAESGPLRAGAPVMDYGTALAASFAVSAALYQRGQTGRGTFIDVSMLETAFTLMSSTVTDYLATGNAPQPRGNLANSRSPGAGSFPCRDGVISLGVNEEHQFTALAKVIGRDDWLSDAQFATPTARKQNAAALQRQLETALLARSAEDWEKAMLAAGVPAARLRTLPESLAMDQVKARHYLHKDAETGVTVPTLPFRIGGADVHAPRRAPAAHGADTEAVLASLGYDAEGVAALREDGSVA